jgi:hypothetical protein
MPNLQQEELVPYVVICVSLTSVPVAIGVPGNTIPLAGRILLDRARDVP